MLLRTEEEDLKYLPNHIQENKLLVFDKIFPFKITLHVRPIKVVLLLTIDGWTMCSNFLRPIVARSHKQDVEALIFKTLPMMDRSCINLNCPFGAVWDHILSQLNGFEHRKTPNHTSF